MAIGLLGALNSTNFPQYGGALFGDYLDGTQAAVWTKGHTIQGLDPRFVLMDDFGFTMHRHEYGNRSSPFGWEVDHIHPKSMGGLNVFHNLRPLNCRKNAQLGGLVGGLLG